MVTLNDVTVREGTRYFTATIDGVRYEIPEMWSVGYCTTHGGTALDAALAWHEQAVMAAEYEAQQKRAIVRFNDNGYVSVLCPRGHLITSYKLDWSFGGSSFEADCAAHAAGLPNSFDRRAAKCQGTGCE